MSVIAVYSVPAAEFLLGTVLNRYPTVDVRLEAVVPVEEAAVPYLWVSGATDEVRELMAAEETIAAVAALDETDAGTLLRISWHGTTDDLLSQVVAWNGSLLDGRTDDGEWTLRLRFPDRESLAAFDRGCRRHDIATRLDRLHGLQEETDDDQLLTQTQREALRIALTLGYFDVPRRTTLAELAAELEISDNAVSQRLRRGVKRLVETTVGAD